MINKILLVIPFIIILYYTEIIDVHPFLSNYEFLLGSTLLGIYLSILYKYVKKASKKFLILGLCCIGLHILIVTLVHTQRKFLFSKGGYHFYQHYGYHYIGLNNCIWEGKCDVFVYKDMSVIPIIYYVTTFKGQFSTFNLIQKEKIRITYDSVCYCDKVILFEGYEDMGGGVEYYLK